MIATLPERSLKLNFPQVILTMAQYKETYFEGGRGIGKSTIIAWRIKDIVEQMPRSKCGIVCSTFQQALTRTLPSTLEGLELLGFKKDLHFWVGKRPPKEFKIPEAHQPPLSYDNCIIFYNGTTFQLISLENPNSGRGLNLDAVIGDEAALLDFEKLSYNVLLSNRGNINRFKHSWLHHSTLFCSTTPITTLGKWFIKQEENARSNPKDIFYLIAQSSYNIENLGIEFFKQNKRLLTPLLYDAEIDCIRPGKVETGFYPAYNEAVHTYSASNDNYLFGLNYDLAKLRERHCKFDSDVQTLKPIDIGMDYGAKINTLVAGQMDGAWVHPGKYNIINAMFVKSPKTAPTLAQEFCDYYRYHLKKVVNYYFDHTAMYRDAVRTTTFAEEVRKVFESNGWTVNMFYCGQAPLHDTKYLFFDLVFKEREPALPVVRINKEKCLYLTTSIEMAGAMEGRRGIEKDKRPERQENAVDEETTHFSDAFDTLVYFKFKDGLSPIGYLM